ncbi:MAG: bifunctional phosphopantothenoylcysteine decarboxylase/phosphopantothenate--cysteine ligase CoaBC [Candidatus Thermoplasmatota archaeon]|nr:bifunctional phosphopantothenoylcysteine decarboxylase/phosphopantothenate--cysteine ligase CoaBC [Candidatus Thermoplasmatota archaeon]
MHPADEIRGEKSKKLQDKKIVLGVTGSIAAVETVKLARELIRHGSRVYPVMTPAATRIIHPDALWFATGVEPIISLTGETQHVEMCGRVSDKADLFLISPCTANTISKISYGIDDTAVTTFASTAIGSKIPIIIVPAMHLSMYNHKFVQENIEKCKKIGINFIDPKIERNKAKLPSIKEIVTNVIRLIGVSDLKNKNVLIIGGSSIEPIDDVRAISNQSSGKTAISLAMSSFLRGAKVELWYGCSSEPVPEFLNYSRFSTLDELIELLETTSLTKFNIIVLCAALADYKPDKINGKISSKREKLIIELKPTKKIMTILRKLAPKATIVGFKLEESSESLKKSMEELIDRYSIDFVVGNIISALNKDETEIWLMDKKYKTLNKKGSKLEIADQIFDTILKG